MLAQDGLTGRVPLESGHAQPPDAGLQALFHPDPLLIAVGQQPLSPGGAVVRRLLVARRRLPGVWNGADSLLIAHAQIAQSGQTAHLHRLLIEPEGLPGVGLHPQPLFQAQPQVAGPPAAAQGGGPAEALYAAALSPVLRHPEDAQGGPLVSGELLLLCGSQGTAAPGTRLRHGLPLSPKAAVIIHTVVDHRVSLSFLSRYSGPHTPCSRMR